MSEELFGNAIKLTRKDFDIKEDGVHINNHSLDNVDGCLIIYAPWCPHCQSKDTPVNNAINIMKEFKINDYKIAVANGDDPEMRDVLMKINCAGFPSFYHILCKNKEGTKVTKVVEMTNEGEGRKLISDIIQLGNENTQSGGTCGLSGGRSEEDEEDEEYDEDEDEEEEDEDEDVADLPDTI
jgi:hypothetical protein